MVDWASILAEHGSTVWRTVFRLLNHHADALDCYQETFLAALRIAERQPIADWPALLVSLATRRALDRLRQRYRSRGRSIPLNEIAEPSSEAEGPLSQARASELMDRVREGIAGLPDKQAEALWLSCLEGRSHHEIAALMQVPQGEVRVLIHRARARLGAFLDLKGHHEGKTP